MQIIKAVDLHTNFRNICEYVLKGERVVVTRPHSQNLVLISEEKYDELRGKNKRNTEYLKKIKKSHKEYKNGEYISYSLEQLKAMEK
jgi:PHD/YefM family antitoxin component YafN of YafNO toxin-antitoxin module